MSASTASTTCSGCSTLVALNITRGIAVMRVPSNGKRGSLHVPAHTVQSTVWTTDDYLWTWDCPICGYADSWTEDELED